MRSAGIRFIEPEERWDQQNRPYLDYWDTFDGPKIDLTETDSSEDEDVVMIDLTQDEEEKPQKRSAENDLEATYETKKSRRVSRTLKSCDDGLCKFPGCEDEQTSCISGESIYCEYHAQYYCDHNPDHVEAYLNDHQWGHEWMCRQCYEDEARTNCRNCGDLLNNDGECESFVNHQFVCPRCFGDLEDGICDYCNDPE